MDGVSEGPWWSTPEQQARVISHSMRVRDKDIRPLKELRQAMVGPHFGGGVGDRSVEKPTNTTYGFYARYRGDVLGGDLKCQIQVDAGAPEERLLLEYESACNTIYERSGGPEVSELAFADMCCGYGAVLVMPPETTTVELSEQERETMKQPLGVKPWKGKKNAGKMPAVEPTPVTDADPRHPRLRYLEPSTWFWDRSAFTMAEAEFIGYETTHNLDELLEEAREEGSGWDLEKLNDIQTRVSDSKKNKLRSGVSESENVDGERNRITLITLLSWSAELEEDRPENHNAVAYVLWSPTDAPESAEWVKKPAYFFAPPFPNVALYYQHITGEDSLPFSSLTANKTKIEARDAMHAMAYRRIKDIKRSYAMDARHKGVADRIEAADDGEIVLVPNMAETGGMEEIQKGGLDAPVVAGIQYLDQLAMEDLGLSAAARGGTSGDTATENEIAEDKSSALVLQFGQAFNRGAANMFRIIAWYVAHDPTVATRADIEARTEDIYRRELERAAVSSPDEFNPDEIRRVARAQAEAVGGAVSQGGDFAGEDGLDFNALRFQIDAILQRARTIEARRVESAQFRADLFQVLTGIAQFGTFFDFSAEIRRLEEDYGRRGLMSRVDKGFLKSFAQTHLADQTAGAGQSLGTPSSEQGAGGGPRRTIMDGPVQGRSETVRRAASQNGTE